MKCRHAIILNYYANRINYTLRTLKRVGTNAFNILFNYMSAFVAVFADTRYSLNMPSTNRNAWGNLATPTGQITWRKSYFKTTYVNVIYIMFNQR